MPRSTGAGGIVRRMRLRHCIGTLGLAFSLVCVGGVASATGHSAIHNGYYSSYRNALGPGNFFVGLKVGANGHDLIGGMRGSGVSCTVGPSLTAQDPNEFTSITVISIHLPRNLPISASGSFSFSGDVKLTAEDTQTTMSFTEPITLTGHFSLGKVVAHKGIAERGTFSAPAICETQTPATYSDQWDVSDK